MSIALVTGANRGIGLATARALAKQGMCVLLAARDETNAERAAAELRAEGLDVRGVQLDVTAPGSVAAAAQWVGERYDRLDILVNNAGVIVEDPANAPDGVGTVELFRATFETNLFGVVAVTEAFLPLLRRSPMGRIVNVSSTMGSMADQNDPDSPFRQSVVPAYRSSKSALNSVTITLARQLADTPIKVTSVCPGFVQTDLTALNREFAPLTAEQAAQTVLRAALLADDAVSGSFIDQQGAVAW